MEPRGVVIKIKTPKKVVTIPITIIKKISNLNLNCFFLKYPIDTAADVSKSFNRFIAIAKNTSPVNNRIIGKTIPKPV